MKAFVVVLLMISTAAAGPAKVKFGAAEGDLGQALAQIAETGRITIVLVGVTPQTVKLPAEEPWDAALDEVLTAASLDRDSKGSVEIVAPTAWIVEHKKAKAKKYSGAPVTLYAHDGDPTAIGQLLALTTGRRIGIANGQHPITVVLRKVPSDQALDLLIAQSDGASAEKPAAVTAPGKSCLAPNVQSAALKLVAIASRGSDYYALFLDDKGGPVFATQTTCLGSDKAKVKAFHNGNTIDLAQGGALHVISVP